jgi:hypothetical protein
MTNGQMVTLSKRYPVRKFRLYATLGLLKKYEDEKDHTVTLVAFPVSRETLKVTGIRVKKNVALTEIRFSVPLGGRVFTFGGEDFLKVKDPMVKAWIAQLTKALADESYSIK